MFHVIEKTSVFKLKLICRYYGCLKILFITLFWTYRHYESYLARQSQLVAINNYYFRFYLENIILKKYLLYFLRLHLPVPVFF